MIDKERIIRFLYVASFPFFGIGQYISATYSPSVGFVFSSLPPLAILLFYAGDKLYQREIEVRINKNYIWVILFLISGVYALFASYKKGLPDLSLPVALGMSILLVVPFHAFMVCHFYSRHTDKSRFADLTFLGLGILLFINLFGYFGLGIINQTHHIEGRVNFPFLGGLYDGAGLLAIISLMIFLYVWQRRYRLIPTALLLAYLGINLILLFFINSRLSIMILLLVLALFATNLIKGVRGVYLISWFTLPILLSSGLLLYKILQLPFFTSVMQRVNLVDVTTFNGRSFLWQNGLDWLFSDQRGLLFGNGYRGHYFIDLVSDVALLWNQEDLHVMHLHSTSLEILVSQGLLPLLVFMGLGYKAYRFYRIQYNRRSEDGLFFASVVFIIFVMQVDSFVYLNSLGFLVWAALLSRIVVWHDDTEGKIAQS